jgi:hypothetical protein
VIPEPKIATCREWLADVERLRLWLDAARPPSAEAAAQRYAYRAQLEMTRGWLLRMLAEEASDDG